MRMTRAALRAQEAEEELQAQIEGKLREQGLSLQNDNDSVEPLIHEDCDEDQTADNTNETGQQGDEDSRPALKDITSDNYPTAAAENTTVVESDESELRRTKNTKGKKGRKLGAKKDVTTKESPDDVFTEGAKEQIQDDPQTLTKTISSPQSSSSETESELEPKSVQDAIPELHTISDSEVTGVSVQTDMQELPLNVSAEGQENSIKGDQKTTTAIPETPSKLTATISKTPRFDPNIHLPVGDISHDSSDNTEDSFVDSIKTRSPSKLLQSVCKSANQEQDSLLFGTETKQTPFKPYKQTPSQSPQRIEDSVEAIDALEEAIEKFAEDLPIIEALPFESPIRSRKTPSRTPAKTISKTPAQPSPQVSVKPLSKTPAKISAKEATQTLLQTSLKLGSQTPGRITTKMSTTTPAKPETPKTSVSSMDKVASKSPSTLKDKTSPAKRETVKDRVKAIESGPTPAHRRATSVNVSKKSAPEIRPTLKSKHKATKSVSSVATTSATSLSFSNSPVKQNANEPKKRVTSGGILSTSKPGFVPAKSSKPPTTSTFALPGEAIAAKLKAQREERAKKEATEAEKKTSFKARPAPTRTARPSVMPRENKTSAARMSVRQASGENKENVAPISSVSSTGSARPAASATTKSGSSTTANSSVRRTAVAPKPASTIESRKSMVPASVSAQSSQRITSLTSGQQIALTKTEAAQQKLRGKEVYSRFKGSIQQQEEERKAKEEAAKKARAEAAERGRQASREWAKKQKEKMMSGAKTVVTTVTAVDATT